MAAFIRSSACISAQNTANANGLPVSFAAFQSNKLSCIEPNYKDYINPLQLRRMSKVLKMGLGASMICLKNGNLNDPDAIIVGTGLGCSEDLEKFLVSFLDNNEQVLSPTPFIQSTHNMVAAQIAVVLKNHKYNMTYCHRGFSFEAALTDALMLIKDGQAKTVLVGGIDEMTPNNFLFFNYLNYWKKDIDSNLKLFEHHNSGTIAGEGAAFFMISSDGNDNSTEIRDVSMVYKPKNNKEVKENINAFLNRNQLNKDSIDSVMLGMNGDNDSDMIYKQLMDDFFSSQSLFTYYKHLCGEYVASTSFALWLADYILRSQNIPEIVKIGKSQTKAVKNILIYNHYRNNNHSLILISRK
jgi:3-oxoacyl-[acyl-carrier-protein] synthase II